MSSPPSSEGDPPDGGESSSSKNEAVSASAAAAATAASGDDEMEDIKQFVIRSSQNLKSDSPKGEVEVEAGDAKPSPSSSSTSKQSKEEEKKKEEEQLRDEKERGLPPPLPQPKMYVMPKTTAATAATEKSPAPTLSGQLPPPATRQITIRAPTVQKAGIGPKIHLQQNIQLQQPTKQHIRLQVPTIKKEAPSPIKSNKPPQIALSTAGGQLIQIRMPSTPGSSSSSPAILGRSPQIQIAPPSSATSVPSAVSAATPPKIQLPSVPLPQSSVSVGPALSAKNAVPTVTMANGGGDIGPKIRYKCPFCPFSSDSQAPVHSHLKAKKYRCSGCGFLTCSKEAITQHQMDKHGKTHIQLEQQERQDRQEQQQQQQAKRPAAGTGGGAGPAAVASMSDGGPAAKRRNTGRSPSSGAHGPPPILSSPPPLPSGLKVGGSSGMAMIQLPTTPVPPPQLMDATATADLPGLGGIKLPQHPTPPNPLPPPPLPQTPRQITTYTCAICRSYNATTEAAVEEHARLAHNIQQHQLNLGSTGKRYLCQFCDFVSTTSKEEVVNHILSAHPHGSQGPATTYACPHCTYKSTVASEIERHVRESHTLNPAPVAPPPPPAIPPEMETTRYACAYCNFVSDSVPAVQAHSLEVHNVALAGADEATEMLQTTTTTQPPQPPPLPQIPVDPATVAGAAAAPAPLPMICPHCGAGFEESSLFKAHLDSHGSSALASSGATPPSTPSKSTPARKGPKPSLRKNFCETCGLQLPDRNAYIAHNRANHPQRNKCQFCDYTSPRPYNVKAHTEQVHFGRKPHACDACDFKASRRSALEQHVQNKHPGHPPPPVGWKRPGEAEDDDIPLLPIKVPGKVGEDPHGGEHESPNRVLVQPANGSSNLNSLQFMLDDGPGTPTAAAGTGGAAGAAARGEEGQVAHVVGKVEASSGGGNDSGISSSNHSSSVVVDNLTYPSAQLGVMSDMNDVLNGYHAAVHDDINMVSAEETVVSSNNNEHGGQQFILSDVALEGQAATGPNGEQILATVDISSAAGQQALLDYSAAESFNGGGQQVLASLDVEGMPVGNPLGVKPKKQFHRNQPTETELTCDLCGYLANSRYAKKRHVKLVHDKRKDYTCTLCNQMFGQHGDAKRHAASKHKIPDGSTVKRLCFD